MENKPFDDMDNNLEAYWKSLRKRSADHSFPKMADWIREVHKNVGRSRLAKIKRRKRSGWFAFAILSLFLVLSFTIRVTRVEKSGSVITFSVDKKEDRSFQELSSLQQLFTFTCYEFLQPDQPFVAFFIFFIPDKEQKKLRLITRELNSLNGLRKMDISSVNYTIKESLFSTFLHKSLKVGKEQEPNKKELVREIQSVLKNKGFGSLSINILVDNNGDVAFGSSGQKSDSSAITITSAPPGDNKRSANDKPYSTKAGMEKLQIFNWLLGSWKVKYVPQTTYHHWFKINDSLLMCFIIKDDNDDTPDISVGFSIKYTNPGSTILSLRDIKWKFLSANDKEITFKNEVTPKSANVKWVLSNEEKTWQSVISGEKNLEIVNLIKDENINLENIVKEFVVQHPEIIRAALD